MRSLETLTTEEILRELIHDLRQPLGNIETSAYVIQLVMAESTPRAQEHLRMIEQQVNRAALLLTKAERALLTTAVV